MDSAENNLEEDMPDGMFVRWLACFLASIGGLFVLFSSPTLVWTGQVAIFLIDNHISATWTIAFLVGVDVTAAFFAWMFAAPMSDWLTLKIFKIDMKPWNKKWGLN